MIINHNTKNTIIRGLVRSFPSIFSRETVQQLVRDNQISVEAATDIVSVVETTNPERANQPSKESVISAASVSDFKLSAALEILKVEERAVYDEFLRVDADRQAIISKIAATYNNDVNNVIGVLKTAPGVNIKEIDEILASPIVADKAGFGFSTLNNNSSVKL